MMCILLMLVPFGAVLPLRRVRVVLTMVLPLLTLVHLQPLVTLLLSLQRRTCGMMVIAVIVLLWLVMVLGTALMMMTSGIATMRSKIVRLRRVLWRRVRSGVIMMALLKIRTRVVRCWSEEVGGRRAGCGCGCCPVRRLLEASGLLTPRRCL